MTLYDRLQELAQRENIIAGVGTSEPFYELKKKLMGVCVPFVNYTLEERTEPAVTMPNVGSIVAVGLSYNVVYDKINDGKYRGNISAGAVGRDYHNVVMEKLNAIYSELLRDYDVLMFTDTGPLVDREVAVRCGLGYIGKNLSVISPKIGSMFFIGYMLTNVEYTKWGKICNDEEKVQGCGDCRKCIDACPNGAIKNGRCIYERCISYITQKKGVLSNEECNAVGRQIYGCDICQRVCPKNKNYERERSTYAYPDIEELLNMSNKEFNAVFKSTAAGWRGRRTLQRNAVIALGNMRAVHLSDMLNELSKSDREDIAAAAKYALCKIKEM